MLLASIPSPSNPFVFHLGPLAPRWYGILLAVGILGLLGKLVVLQMIRTAE